jgi:hypothetical protein
MYTLYTDVSENHTALISVFPLRNHRKFSGSTQVNPLLASRSFWRLDRPASICARGLAEAESTVCFGLILYPENGGNTFLRNRLALLVVFSTICRWPCIVFTLHLRYQTWSISSRVAVDTIRVSLILLCSWVIYVYSFHLQVRGLWSFLLHLMILSSPV